MSVDGHIPVAPGLADVTRSVTSLGQLPCYTTKRDDTPCLTN